MNDLTAKEKNRIDVNSFIDEWNKIKDPDALRRVHFKGGYIVANWYYIYSSENHRRRVDFRIVYRESREHNFMVGSIQLREITGVEEIKWNAI